MLVPNQKVEIKVIGITLDHYRKLGYDVKIFDTITVPVEHLTTGSKVVVQVKCDVCGKDIPRPYKQYLHYHSQGIDTCNEHKNIKTKETCKEKYGVENVFQFDDFKQKHKQTCLERYGYEYISQAPEIRERIKKTCNGKYNGNNPMYSDEVKNKIKQTNLERYGVENPLQNTDIHQKMIATNIERYGVPYVLQNPQIKAKANYTLSKNGDVPTSSQQLKIYDIVKQKYHDAQLNYPFSMCSLDVFLNVNGINIDIEYDGYRWHQDQQADIKRDKFLQSNGFKVLRVRSGHKLPTEEELFTTIDELITTDRKFKEIILSDWQQHKINDRQEVSA